MYKRIKITVKTPKNKAEKSVDSLRKSILLFRKDKILEQKITAHNEFYWVLDTIDEKDYVEVVNNCAKAEHKIKKFYQLLISAIKISNRGLSRFKFLSKAVLTLSKNKILRFLKGKGIKEDDKFMKDMREMPPEEYKEFIAAEGVEDIRILISNDIITIEEYKELEEKQK